MTMFIWLASVVSSWVGFFWILFLKWHLRTEIEKAMPISVKTSTNGGKKAGYNGDERIAIVCKAFNDRHV